jgi:hypothetical protein
VPTLCTGLIHTAERLRYLALRRAAGTHGEADVASSSWQRTAQGAAITSHCTELILRSLSHDGALAMTDADRTDLQQAAQACRQSTTAWRIVTHAWDTFTTGPALTLAPVAAEIGDLVLRAGRLARQNPQWTPALRQASPARHPADLADQITNVLAALREANDALTQIAAHDRDTVHLAARRGHLFVPRRLLSDGYEPAHRYAPAPLSLTDTLRSAYDTAVAAGAKANTALRHAADALNCPQPTLDARQAAAKDGAPFLANPSPPLSPPAIQTQAGQIEATLNRLDITEPALLTHARQIDSDTRELMTAVTAKLQERTPTGIPPRRPDDPPDHRHHPAHLAALDAPPGNSRRTSAPQAHPGLGPARGHRHRSPPRRNVVNRTGRRDRTHYCCYGAPLAGADCAWPSPA